MPELVLEVGMKLDKNLIYYHEMLNNHGLKLLFSVHTRDVYYSKQDNFDGLSENNIKNSCVRIRYVQKINDDENSFKDNLKKEKELLKRGYKKVFDTSKLDFHYGNKKMKGRIQLQDIKDIGLLVYYDNSKYYKYDTDKQRRLLLEELNGYGFDFKESDLGLDKLRTLYYGKEMYSKKRRITTPVSDVELSTKDKVLLFVFS